MQLFLPKSHSAGTQRRVWGYISKACVCDSIRGPQVMYEALEVTRNQLPYTPHLEHNWMQSDSFSVVRQPSHPCSDPTIPADLPTVRQVCISAGAKFTKTSQRCPQPANHPANVPPWFQHTLNFFLTWACSCLVY